MWPFGTKSRSEKLLAKRVAALPWTAHNIRLTKHVETIPGEPEFIKVHGRLILAKRLCKSIFGADWSGLRIADLGCLEGGYSLGFALDGATALGIEGRAINYEKCKLIEDHFALPNLRFVQDDVKNFTPENYGQFDAVLVCGLLYHLDDPVAWLRQIAPCVKTMLFLDTHYAPEGDQALAGLDEAYASLSPLTAHSPERPGYRGRWFREFADDAPREAIDGMHWAAVSNTRSFWLTRPSLLKCLEECGFDLVGERSDFMPGDEFPAWLREKSRSCFFAVRLPAEMKRRDAG